MIRSVALVISLIAGSFSQSALASDQEVNEAFQLLSHEPADFFDFGSVCEHLARLQLYNKFPKQEYHIESGIIYTNNHGSVLGELDIVVFHRNQNKAVLIGEVKCWRELGSAMKKARMQLARFADTLKRNTPIKLYDAETHHAYSRNQFQNQNMRSIYISQNGGEQFGFHMSIGLEHEEVQQVRAMLLKCQKVGRCPKAMQRR